jgi:molybdopterin converting factor small subunit
VIKILFFGRLGDLIGREVDVDPSGANTVAELRRVLVALYPHAAADLTNPVVQACITDRIVAEETSVSGVAEVEFFPPLSGG